MGKTIRFNENSLIAIKKGLNEIMAGSDGIVSHNDVSPVKLYHGTTIDALIAILKTNRVCADEGKQHGETHGMNWFSLVNDGSFNRGACFSIEVPGDEFSTIFHKMNNVHVITKDSCLDVSSYNIKVEYLCGHPREGLINLYNVLIEKGERWPVEWVRDNLFYKWCEESGNEDLYVQVNDYDFGLIMANVWGEDVVRKEGFIKESVINEVAPEVDTYELGGEEKNGTNVMGGNCLHAKKIKENYDPYLKCDADSINTIIFTPHEDAKEEGYENEEDIESFEPYYEIEALDANYERLVFFDLTRDELFEYFPEDVANDIINRNESADVRQVGSNEYRIDDLVYRNTSPSNIDDVNEVNSIAKRIATGGPSAYLLTDGDVISFHDHIYITSIDGMTPNKFIALGNIRLTCGGGIELIKEPTRDQYYGIKQWVRGQEGTIYLDICKPSNNTYPTTLLSVKYSEPNGERIVNDIYYYFENGIRPIGESEEKKGKLISETNIPQEFIDNAIKLRPDRFHNWVVVDLVDVGRMPQYFEKKEMAKEYLDWLRRGRENSPAMFDLNRVGNVNENYEKEVESSEVDLSSFKKKDSLHPGIWKDEETLNSKVRLKLLDIADDFWEFVNLTWVEPKGIIITGSICNFNWSKFSDIDLHLIVDFNEIDSKTEFVREYLNAKKNEWNNEHEDLKIMGFPVELYVQDMGENPEAGGIYDLEENAWVRRPNPHTIKNIGLEKFGIKDKAASIMTIIDDMYKALSNTGDGYEIDKIGEDAGYLWDKVKSLRKKSLDKDGESGAGNIVYKVLRRTGYLDKLWKMRTKVYDRSNSITEGMKKYLTVLKEEIAMDGSTEKNPYEERWKAERNALKNFVANYGKLMQSREDNKNGKLYKVYFDETMSNLIGYNYCICVQWNEQEMKPGSTVYIRALDKFTPFIRRNLQFDDRGHDNMRGTWDDTNSRLFN